MAQFVIIASLEYELLHIVSFARRLRVGFLLNEALRCFRIRQQFGFA